MKLVANPSWLRRKLWVLPWLTAKSQAIQLALSPITDARHTQTTKLGMQWHLSNAWTALFGTAFSLILPCPAFTAGWKEIFSCYFCKTDLVQWTGEVMIKAGLVLTDERVQAWACKYLELPWCIGKGKPKYSHCLIHTLGKIWPIIVKMFSTILHGWFFFLILTDTLNSQRDLKYWIAVFPKVKCDESSTFGSFLEHRFSIFSACFCKKKKVLDIEPHSPFFLLVLVSGFSGLCRQNSLENVSSFKCISLCISDFLNCWDHPDPVFFSGDVVIILVLSHWVLSHCQLLTDFPFLVMEDCYGKVS